MTTLAEQHRAFIQAEGTFHVDVYRESPEWDKYDRWWQMPSDLLRELFVERWDCGEYDAEALVKELRQKYPEHRLLYVLPDCFR